MQSKTVLALLTAALAAPLAAQEATLADCQAWQDQINYYAKMRRKGGRVAEMEDWKRQKRRYEKNSAIMIAGSGTVGRLSSHHAADRLRLISEVASCDYRSLTV